MDSGPEAEATINSIQCENEDGINNDGLALVVIGMKGMFQNFLKNMFDDFDNQMDQAKNGMQDIANEIQYIVELKNRQKQHGKLPPQIRIRRSVSKRISGSSADAGFRKKRVIRPMRADMFS
ncbi:MAG: hypothetical protein ACU84H_09435 [Gammaproteobacteria bacterium]